MSMASTQSVKCINCGLLLAAINLKDESVRTIKLKLNVEGQVEETTIASESSFNLSDGREIVCPGCGTANKIY